MQPVTPARALTEIEAAVIAAAIARAPFGDPGPASSYLQPELKVVGRCDCGCDSVFFEGIETAKEQYRIADGLGYSAEGEEIGVIVWADNGRIVHLELYNYTENLPRLPLPDSVCPFEESRRVRQ